MPETTNFDITFAAPALPLSPMEYDQRHFNDINNSLRLYFNQIDQALRNTDIANQAEATSWFIG